MLDHLLYTAALNAPELGSALVVGLSRRVASSMYDEFTSRLKQDVPSLAGLLGGATSMASGASCAIEQHVRAVVEGHLAGSGVTLVSVREVELLRQLADAAATNKDLSGLLLQLREHLKGDAMTAPRLATIDDAAPNISEGKGVGMDVFLEELGGSTMVARIGQEILTARRHLGARCIDVTRGPSYPSPRGDTVTGGRYLLRDGGPGASTIGALNYTLLGRGTRAKAVVSNIVASASHRRQGIASRLLEEMLADFPAARADTAMTSLGAAFLGYSPAAAAAPATRKARP